MDRNSNGTIKKGTVLNPSGKPRGAKNRTTIEVKQALQKIVDKELDQVDKYLKQLEPKERLDFLIKLLPYVTPKQSEIEVKEMLPEIKAIEFNVVYPTKKNLEK